MRHKKAFLLFAILIVAFGCAGKSAPKGPKFLFPKSARGAIYAEIGQTVVYETEDARLSLTVLTDKREIDSPFIGRLLDSGYIVFRMRITNRSGIKKVIYNPSHTALMDNRMGYKKPLDYTALYEIAMRSGEELKIRKELTGKFIDLNENVGPGKSSSKFLLFPPLSDGATSAKLMMKLIYIGTDTVSLTFPYYYKPIEIETVAP